MDSVIGIVILNYNGLLDTIQLIESIRKTVTSVQYSLIVVDNDSDDNEAKRLEMIYHEQVTAIRAKDNHGYAAGNNIGIRYAVQKGLDYICILNNDTIVSDDFFGKCIEYLDSHPDIAFVSPAIVDVNNTVQSMGGTYSLLKGNAYYNNSGEKYENVAEEAIRCDMVFGACLVFKTALIEQIGYLPEAYFLFYEETEWCLKARKAGLECVCLANHFLIHKGSATINQIGGLSEYLFERNRVLFAKRNLSRMRFLCFLVFDFCRLVYQCAAYRVPFKRYFKYHLDGLLGRIDSRFPFIWVNEEA